MHELAKTDGGRVAVTGHADAEKFVVGQRRACSNRRHASMHGVEAMRPRQKVRRRFRGASDAGKFGNMLRLDVHLEERANDLIADGVVTAAGAQRRLPAVIIGRLQSDAILFRRLGSNLDYGFSH